MLALARMRARGRRERQQVLLHSRKGKDSTDWGVLGVIGGFLFTALLHGIAVFALVEAVDTAQRVSIERAGNIVVRERFLEKLGNGGRLSGDSPKTGTSPLESLYHDEAEYQARHNGRSVAENEERLRREISANGSRNLIPTGAVKDSLSTLPETGALPNLLGSLVLLWWMAMLVCQGEGLELDLQRRRYPMWEWLFTHPVQPGAVFLAEMLSPLAANPVYWSAPVFVGGLYWLVHDFSTGAAAALLCGIPLSISLACAAKAVEIVALLRLPPRSRGAVIGVLSWFGYASMMLLFFATTLIPRIVAVSAPWLSIVAMVPWPWLKLFVGFSGQGEASFFRGVAFCWAISIVTVAAAVAASVWSTRRGLSGAFAAETVSHPSGTRVRFGGDPLFRKERLWFIRDKSAIVQTILIPITVAGFQIVNLRSVVTHAQEQWNYLAGAAILFGTYFLWVLGPKSLASEGSALWIALTWPRGLESLLKAKAWLWSIISSCLVTAVLFAGTLLFPQATWKIALVGAGWFLFARSMAEKSVTLVTVAAESGEADKIPFGRRWAAQLGMLSFAIGVCTMEWTLAISGIVYSWITAAAMWEHFRARLPYLYDPWSERVPPPPTLMHAMVSVSILVEIASMVMLAAYAFSGSKYMAVTRVAGYAVGAIVVWFGTSNYLSYHNVPDDQIWSWNTATSSPGGSSQTGSWVQRYVFRNWNDLQWLFAGLGGGVVLALVAKGYVEVLRLIPSTAGMLRASDQQMQSIPGLHAGYALTAIVFAPFAEEYLFRGLLYRALDREWGGWRAVLAGAAFFAIYHQPLAWLPVGLVGVANCLLFRKSGRLAPAVVLHVVYNAIVV